MSCTPFHRFGPLKIVLVSARRELREGRLMVAKGVTSVDTHTHTHTHTHIPEAYNMFDIPQRH